MLQWGHGDEAVEEHRLQNRIPRMVYRFNGATAMKPWKSMDPLSPPPTTPTLQWGHGDEAVEEVATPIAHLAAMTLQWGHGDEAVEEAASSEYQCRADPASMGPRR